MPLLIAKNEQRGIKPNPKYPAGLSLEAALVLTPLLLLLVSFVFLLYAKLMVLQLSYAADQCSLEMAVLFPAVEAVLEGAGEESAKIVQGILDPEDRSVLESVVGDYTSSLLLGPLLEKRIDYWLQVKRDGGGIPLIAHERQTLFTWHQSGKCLCLTIYFSVDTLFGPYEQCVQSLVPLWSQYSKENGQQGAEEKEEALDDVWSWDNFSRGRYFREREGANLPFNFPVIASFHSGHAKSIRSMDVNAPSYQELECARKSILLDLDRLQQFQEHQSKRASLSIQAGDICSKEYVLIIPENIPAVYNTSFFSFLEQEAKSRGLSFTLKRLGQSRRYEQEE